ncbi:F-box/LRR-repeat protein 3-like [Venturia canescens]|uniref:F-box/LRR-repeat protein 3-like n=1 Tax=Venturia canescens TaxID=32260 RepID=UPI001C9BC5E4|nr:F-box/LRR-repeat protein 3-like [Venturia canescens]
MQALMNASSMRSFFEHRDGYSLTGTTVIADGTPFETLSIDDIPAEDPNIIAPTSKDCNNLQRLRIKNTSGTSPDDIVTLINRCRFLRELSISYSMLSDDLLFALSTEEHCHLETVRIEAQPDSKPLPRITDEAWFALETHSPQINVVLTSYLSDEDDCDPLLATYVPITHLYFGGEIPAPVVHRIGDNCPRLVELVVGSYESDVIDADLISAANGCPRLSTVGLGHCEITCSGLVDFVSRCRERLRVLYVWETSLIEDCELGIAETAAEISRLLGRPWVPEYVPPW